MHTQGARHKQVLYFAPEPGGRLNSLLDTLGDVTRLDGDLHPSLKVDDIALCWREVNTPERLFQQLQQTYVNLIVLDLRHHAAQSLEASAEAGRSVLETLDHTQDLESRYAFHRILVLISGEGDATDALIAELGGWGVGAILRERPNVGEVPDVYGARVLDTILKMILHHQPRQSALCLAGGGITGIYFELGALKCLDDCLTPGVNQAFDMFFGISAGAVVGGLLAAGYSPDEIMASLAGVPGGRVFPISLKLLSWRHVNYRDMLRRVYEASRATLQQGARSIREGRPMFDATVLFLEYTALIGAPFHAEYFEEILRKLLSAPGTSNDFRDLPTPLFIGPSNQDTRRHVLFGSAEHDHVPISKAIQASLSINPAFSSVNIDGHFYEDGAVTRTSNFVEALRRDADLIFVFDPFVPYVSKQIGVSNRRGMLYNIDQDIRTMTFTRFEGTRNWVLRKHPQVSTYTFLPSNRTRELLSINPMDHRPYLEIWRGAYLSTLQRIRQLCHRMRGDLKLHGITIDTAPAEKVAAQLRKTHAPEFADFWPDRRVQLKQPPLCMERQARG